MKAYLPDFDMMSSSTLPQALTALRGGAWLPFAGGTDVMVVLEAGHLAPGKYIDITGLKELQGIVTDDAWFDLGAMTTYSQIQEHPLICAELPSLVQAASETGGIAIQNRGTIGGNIINASPAADSPPALLTYDAVLTLESHSGKREVPLSEFYKDYKKMDRLPEELLTRVRIPRQRYSHHYYRKVGTRRAQAISKVVLSASAKVNRGKVDDIRIAVGSVAPITRRAKATESLLRGSVLDDGLVDKALVTFASELSPIDDIRSNAAYRKEVCTNVLAEFLRQVRS